MVQTTAEAHNYQTKKPNSKTPYITSTDQHKSTKKKGFYKANLKMGKIFSLSVGFSF